MLKETKDVKGVTETWYGSKRNSSSIRIYILVMYRDRQHRVVSGELRFDSVGKTRLPKKASFIVE